MNYPLRILERYTNLRHQDPLLQAQAAAMTTEELETFMDRTILPGQRTLLHPDAISLVPYISNELRNRRITASGYKYSAVSGVGTSVVAHLLGRPRWWAWGGVAALLGLWYGRAREWPQGRF
jgi:hypothetical protein